MTNDEVIRLAYAHAANIVANASQTGQLTPEAVATKVNFIADLLAHGVRKLVTQASFPTAEPQVPVIVTKPKDSK